MFVEDSSTIEDVLNGLIPLESSEALLELCRLNEWDEAALSMQALILGLKFVFEFYFFFLQVFSLSFAVPPLFFLLVPRWILSSFLSVYFFLLFFFFSFFSLQYCT